MRFTKQHLDDLEHVRRRIRYALEDGKGIRLTAHELWLLGKLGLESEPTQQPVAYTLTRQEKRYKPIG